MPSRRKALVKRRGEVDVRRLVTKGVLFGFAQPVDAFACEGSIMPPNGGFLQRREDFIEGILPDPLDAR